VWHGAEDFRDELESSETALVVECDITDADQIAQAFTQTMHRFGTVDVLINNAALRQRDFYPVAGASAVLDTLDLQWERMFAVNIFGALKMTRCFIQPMLDKQRGSIVNISASGSLTTAAGDGVWLGNHPTLLNQPYDASKAALSSMSFYLAEEVKRHNVAVNLVFPSATLTTGSQEMLPGRQALGFTTTFSRPEHVVPLVLHLALQDSSGDTGKAFDVVRWNINHGFGDADAWLASEHAPIEAPPALTAN
jgi:1,1a-dihydroxy-1-hydro-9-fluorenone dehydrogenase